MNGVKELIEENNEKRKLLSEENERLYSDPAPTAAAPR